MKEEERVKVELDLSNYAGKADIVTPGVDKQVLIHQNLLKKII